MEIVDYTEKSFVLIGDTKNYKDILKEFGGKWNPNLKVGAGWIFSNTHKEKIQDWINGKPEVKPIIATHTVFPVVNNNNSGFIDTLIDEFVAKLSNDDEMIEVIDVGKMDEYKNSFFEFLINRNGFMTFSDYEKINVEKFIEYSLVKHLRKQYK